MKAQNKNNNDAGNRSEFDRTFVRYALAGSAILGLPLAAVGQTSTPVSLSGIDYTAVSFDGLAADFGLGTQLGRYNSYPLVLVSGTATSTFLGSGNYPTAFPSIAAVIDNVNGPTISGQYGTLLRKVYNNGTQYVGEWPNDGQTAAWLGVLYQSNGEPYLGLADIQVQVTGSNATADLLQIEDEPLGTPEPASIALLALGASGLALLRRRRKAAN